MIIWGGGGGMIGDWVYFLFILLIGLWPEDMPATYTTEPMTWPSSTEYNNALFWELHCAPVSEEAIWSKSIDAGAGWCPRAHCLTIESRRPAVCRKSHKSRQLHCHRPAIVILHCAKRISIKTSFAYWECLLSVSIVLRFGLCEWWLSWAFLWNGWWLKV